MCKFGNACSYGNRCFFAHSDDEIRHRCEPASGDPGIKLNESVKRSSRRSSTILSEINHELPSPFVSPFDIDSRRFSSMSENSVGCDSPISGVCMIGTLIPALMDISIGSLASGEADSSGFSGDGPPVGQRSREIVLSGTTSVYYACIRYMQSYYKPAVLYQMLKDAEPEFYIE